jgi:hypothetical protein
MIGVLIGFRYRQLRGYLETVNVRPRLLRIGGVFLGVNVVMPLLVRYVHMESNALNRDVRMDPLMLSFWLGLAPLTGLLALLLPFAQSNGSHLAQRRTFPLTVLGLWLVVTCTHLYCIGYMHQATWHRWYLLPVLWVAMWMFYARRNDVHEHLSEPGRKLLLLPGAIISILALPDGGVPIFCLINFLNAMIYGGFWLQERTPFLRQLAGLSVMAMVAGTPDVIINLVPGLDRSFCVGAAIVGFSLWQCLLSHDPRAGVLGGLLIYLANVSLFTYDISNTHLAVELATVFILVHSLRWKRLQGAERFAQVAAASLWVIDSSAWLTQGLAGSVPATLIISATTILYCGLFRWLYGTWGSRLVGISAAIVLSMVPLRQIISMIWAMPVGLLIVGASFLLFGCGTVVALTRDRWHPARPNLYPGSEAVPQTH